MKLINLLIGGIFAIVGIIFGVTIKIKNKKIQKLEQENKIANTNRIHQEYESSIIKKENEISKATIELVQEVANTKEPPMEKPKTNDEDSTKLSEKEKELARSLSTDPFDL